jgi:hypothetical protein
MPKPITFTYGLLLLGMSLFLEINAQEWRPGGNEPASGSLSLLSAVSDGSRFFLIHGFQSPVVTQDGQTFTPKGTQDLLLSALDYEGNISWQIQLANKDAAQVSAACYDRGADQLILTGVFWDTLFFDNRSLTLEGINKAVFFLSVDARDGTVQWARAAGGNGSRWSGGVCSDGFGGLYFTGSFSGRLELEGFPALETEKQAAFLLKMDENGVAAALDVLGEGEEIRPVRCLWHTDGLIHGGTYRGLLTFSPFSDEGRTLDSELFLLKTGQTGQAIWLRTGKGVGDDELTDVAINEDGDIAIGGHFAGNMRFSPDFNIRSLGSLLDGFVVVLDHQGNPKSARVYSNSGTFLTRQVSWIMDHWVLSGTFDGTLFLEKENFTSETGSRSGVSIFWNPESTGESADFMPVNAGQMTSVYRLPGEEGQLLAVNFSGRLTWSGLPWDSDGFRTWWWYRLIPSSVYTLSDEWDGLLHPNPFTWYLEMDPRVSEMELWSLDGRRVLFAREGQTPDIAGLSPGMYLARLKTRPGSVRTQKLIKH